MPPTDNLHSPFHPTPYKYVGMQPKKIDILDSNATCRQVLTTFDMHNNFKMMDHYGTVTAHSKFRSIFFLEFSTSGIMNDI